MPQFTYIAMDARGREQKGKMNAASEEAVANELKRKGLFPTSIRAAVAKGGAKKAKKAGKFKVKVLNSKGKAFKNQAIKIKFKGKTYKLKTNKKGIAVFNVSKNLKVGKYTIKNRQHPQMLPT
jgi:hypothetical protein